MSKKKLKVAVALALAAIAGDAGAQIRPAYQYPPESVLGPTKLGDGPFYVGPYVGLAVGRDDNLFLTNSNEKSTSVFLLSPGVSLGARSATRRLRM